MLSQREVLDSGSSRAIVPGPSSAASVGPPDTQPAASTSTTPSRTPTRARARVGVLLGVVLVLAAGCVSGGPTDAADDGPGTIALLLPESKTSRYESIDRPEFCLLYTS